MACSVPNVCAVVVIMTRFGVPTKPNTAPDLDRKIATGAATASTHCGPACKCGMLDKVGLHAPATADGLSDNTLINTAPTDVPEQAQNRKLPGDLVHSKVKAQRGRATTCCRPRLL